MISIKSALDYETTPTVKLNIKASDKGLPKANTNSTTVTIQVVDLDDERPIFISSNYTASILENSIVGESS